MTGTLADPRVQDAYEKLTILSEAAERKYQALRPAGEDRDFSPDAKLSKAMAYELGRAVIRTRTYLCAIGDCKQDTPNEMKLIQRRQLLQGLQDGIDILAAMRVAIEDKVADETLSTFFTRTVKNNDHAAITKVCSLLSEAIAAETHAINQQWVRLPKKDSAPQYGQQ